MVELAEIFRRYGPQYRVTYGVRMPPSHLAAMTAIKQCRTEALGGQVYQFAVSVAHIDPLPHQLEAVYHYMLRQPRIRFLLADDPGAGKTIMAGLLLKELKLRGAVTRTLIVAPANLAPQWKRELGEKFDEEFDLVDRAALAARDSRAWEISDQCIVSMDFAWRADVLESLARARRWDLVIIRPSRSGAWTRC